MFTHEPGLEAATLPAAHTSCRSALGPHGAPDEEVPGPEETFPPAFHASLPNSHFPANSLSVLSDDFFNTSSNKYSDFLWSNVYSLLFDLSTGFKVFKILMTFLKSMHVNLSLF